MSGHKGGMEAEGGFQSLFSRSTMALGDSSFGLRRPAEIRVALAWVSNVTSLGAPRESRGELVFPVNSFSKRSPQTEMGCRTIWSSFLNITP